MARPFFRRKLNSAGRLADVPVYHRFSHSRNKKVLPVTVRPLDFEEERELNSVRDVSDFLNVNQEHWGQVVKILEQNFRLIKPVYHAAKDPSVKKKIRVLRKKKVVEYLAERLAKLTKRNPGAGYSKAMNWIYHPRGEIRATAASCLIFLSMRAGFKRQLVIGKPSILETVSEYMNREKSAYARATVMETLEGVGNPAFVPLIIHQLKRERSSFVRRLGLDALFVIDFTSESFERIQKDVDRCLKDRHQDVRGTALQVAVKNDPKYTHLIPRFLNSKFEIKQQYGVSALELAWKKYPSQREIIERMTQEALTDLDRRYPKRPFPFNEGGIPIIGLI